MRSHPHGQDSIIADAPNPAGPWEFCVGEAKVDAPQFIIVILILIIIRQYSSQNLGSEPKPFGNQITIKITMRIKNRHAGRCKACRTAMCPTRINLLSRFPDGEDRIA
jgi:hypothetical protein